VLVRIKGAVVSMKRISLVAVFLLFVGHWAVPVAADAVISGPACVIDGNTLQIGGKTKKGECWGGIDVRLYGSLAPKLADACKRIDGTTWPCGAMAKKSLRQLIRLHSITCYHIDGEFDDGIPAVTCLSGRRDLSLEMVTIGMAKAPHDKTRRYELEEAAAKQARRGIWE